MEFLYTTEIWNMEYGSIYGTGRLSRCYYSTMPFIKIVYYRWLFIVLLFMRPLSLHYISPREWSTPVIMHSLNDLLLLLLSTIRVINTYTAKPVCWRELISWSYCSLKPLCSGMGEVVPARTLPTLLPPSPRTVLSLSCFKVSQCINCRDWHHKS